MDERVVGAVLDALVSTVNRGQSRMDPTLLAHGIGHRELRLLSDVYVDGGTRAVRGALRNLFGDGTSLG